MFVDRPADRIYRLCNGLLLATVALLGIAHVAFLPPFEGYDEPAHYSYIQQVADLAQIPRFGEARISRDVEDYPGPLAQSRSSGEADQGRGYRAFFPATIRRCRTGCLASIGLARGSTGKPSIRRFTTF